MGYAVLNYEGSSIVRTNRMIGSLDELLPGEYYSEEEIPVGQRPLSDEELIQLALYKRDSLLTLAAIRVAPLQDAVDRKRSTVQEVEMLDRWKDYRIDLNRIEKQEGFPIDFQWPESPDSTPQP